MVVAEGLGIELKLQLGMGDDLQLSGVHCPGFIYGCVKHKCVPVKH